MAKASFSRVSRENKEKLIALFSKNKKFHPMDLALYTYNQKEALNSVSTLSELEDLIDSPTKTLNFPTLDEDVAAKIHAANTPTIELQLKQLKIERILNESLLGAKMKTSEFKFLASEAVATLDEKDFIEEFKNKKIKEGDYKGEKFTIEELQDLFALSK